MPCQDLLLIKEVNDHITFELIKSLVKIGHDR